MNLNPVRVRFAPSPTGGLHLGGVRTVLFNYLFARRNQGIFVLRIEDTDQNRYVEGAEQYIFDCLQWCGLQPDESVYDGGAYGPYRQSERKGLYRKYVEQLIEKGYAYYAFDTPEELVEMREKYKSTENPVPQYDQKIRMQMRNSLVLSAEETQQLLDAGTPYVVRLKVPGNETIYFTDIIRGEIAHDTNTVDDKVLLKADGMPTYHLAVVVDDHLMEITHVFRGEEWLPSAPVHILLWRFLGWEKEMPQWAHLPLILKPDGNGKLSKRDGERLGFPVFAMDWTDPVTGETAMGFKEHGFLPEAFVNMLAMLGWNPGSEQEIFTLSELCETFSLERVHKGGAKFDYEKAKWFNHQHILRADNDRLARLALPYFEREGVSVDEERLSIVIGFIKERCHLLPELVQQGIFFFKAPEQIALDTVLPKWNEGKRQFFESWTDRFDFEEHSTEGWEQSFSDLATEQGIKKGEVMLPLRIMLVGGKFGPGIFEIASFIGKAEVRKRIQSALAQIKAAGTPSE